jgi:4-hydroxy-3-methylbut-2-enyl diphosphate reductase
MKIYRAKHLGMCFGVRDAITLAVEQSATGPLTIMGELVHNERVLEQLRARGIEIATIDKHEPAGTLMITAHGASDKVRTRLREAGSKVIEGTCPLVRFAHTAIRQLAEAGYHPIIVGQRDHVEVRGLTGDLGEYDVVLNAEDIAGLSPRKRFGIASQTTQPVSRVSELVELIKIRFPEAEIKHVDTVCHPTKQRQRSAQDLAKTCDAVVVVGGARSNNTLELLNSCRQHCAKVFHVQSANDLSEDWFSTAQRVGITAGTSTPDESIDEVETWLRTLAETRKNETL